MAEFRKPSPSTSKPTEVGDEKLKFTGSRGSQIVSPYNGIVTLASGGNVIIKHTIDGKILYSNIEGLGTTYVARNQNVNSGEAVGTFGDNPIIFYLFDGSKNLKASNFFGKEFDKKEKEREKETQNTKRRDSQIDEPRKDYGEFQLTQGLSPLHQMWADLNAAPLKAIKSGLDNIFPKNTPFPKKEGIEKSQKLIEEIERIKSLLK